MKKLTSSDLRRGEGGFALACDWVPGAKCGRPAGHNVSGARKQRVTRKWSPPCKASRLTFSDSFVFPARAHLLKGSSPSQTASPTGTECPNREVYGGHLTFRPQLLDSQVATVFFFFFFLRTLSVLGTLYLALPHPQPLTLPSVWWLPSCSRPGPDK